MPEPIVFIVAGIVLLCSLCIGILIGTVLDRMGRQEARERQVREQRVNELLEDFVQDEMASSIRVIGGSRRGPERVAGPESRERLPFSGKQGR
jgi:hypothetical protein